MAIFSSCFLAEHSGRPTSRLPTAFCLAPHGPVIITRPTRLATFPFMPCVAHFRPPLLCPRGYLWRQSCDWSSIWSTFGKLRSREAGKQLLDGIWAIQNQLDNKWGQFNQSCRSKAFIDQLQDAERRRAIKASVTVPLFVFLYLIWPKVIRFYCETSRLVLAIMAISRGSGSLAKYCINAYFNASEFKKKTRRKSKRDPGKANCWVLSHLDRLHTGIRDQFSILTTSCLTQSWQLVSSTS